jgi:hypothetical protein
MKTYISGYYCRDDLHLQVINKDSNRRILGALRDAYPSGLTVEQLAKKTKLPIKTIYAQKSELYREYYINHFEDEEGGEQRKPKRGRPAIQREREIDDESMRKRVRIVIEEANGVHDIYEGKKPISLPPGNVVYSEGFTNAWHKLISKDEEEDLCKILTQFTDRILNRIFDYDDTLNKETKTAINKWAPERSIEFCCSQCGLNHEARDFIRATFLHLIDRIENNDRFLDLLRNYQFLAPESYEKIKEKRIPKEL